MATMHAGIAKVSIVLSVVGVILVLLIASVFTGYAYVGVKNPAQAVSLRSGACTYSDIEKYNGFAGKADDGEAFTAFASDISKRSAYDSDPNCLYILAQYNIKQDKKDVARGFVDKLSALSKQGVYADGRFNDLVGMNVLYATVRATNENVDQAQLGEG